MSFAMTDIGETIGIADTMIPGVVTGIVDMPMAIVNYSIFKQILASRRNKYAKKIIALSDRIMKGFKHNGG